MGKCSSVWAVVWMSALMLLLCDSASSAFGEERVAHVSAQKLYAEGLVHLRQGEQGFQQAFALLLEAAVEGYAPAQFEVAERYYYGEGVVADPRLAYDWYLKAARNDEYYPPLVNMGRDIDAFCYRLSDAPGGSEELFLEMLRLASWGDALAQKCLGGALMPMVDGLPQRTMEAFKWHLKAARQGDVQAQNTVAEIYWRYGDFPSDDKQAFKWFLKAAEQGDAEGQFMTGYFCFNGFGTVRDEMEALNWFFLAAKQGHAQARLNLGLFYEQGVLVPKNDMQALYWYLRAAHENANPDAQYMAGLMYLNGEDDVRHDALAFEWFFKAAQSRIGNAYYINTAALFHIGVSHHLGRGVARDDDRALYWLGKARKLGDDWHDEIGCWIGQIDSRRAVAVSTISDTGTASVKCPVLPQLFCSVSLCLVK